MNLHTNLDLTKKELVRPAESEKTEEIREKEVPCGSERGKRDRETRKKRKNGSRKEKRDNVYIMV